MTEYDIIWNIQLDAASPREAAEEALKIMRDRFSSAVVFQVTDEHDNVISVDLEVAE